MVAEPITQIMVLNHIAIQRYNIYYEKVQSHNNKK